MTDLAQTLADRNAVYGDFTDHARISQALKDVIFADHGGAKFSAIQNEALEMIAHKIARICSGNPDHKDSWHDIAGYARLVEERLP